LNRDGDGVQCTGVPCVKLWRQAGRHIQAFEQGSAQHSDSFSVGNWTREKSVEVNYCMSVCVCEGHGTADRGESDADKPLVATRRAAHGTCRACSHGND